MQMMDNDNEGNFIQIPNIAAHDEQEEHAQMQRENNGFAPHPVDMVRWRGNLVPEKEAKALRHVFDNLQDHFGHQRPDPRVRFFNNELTHPGGRGQMWNGELGFTYDVNGDPCDLAYMSMDVCIDLAPKLVHKHGQPMLKGYGTSWVYVYLPEPTYDKIKSYVKVGTGWDVSDEGTVHDPNRNLIAIEAIMHHEVDQPKPSFWVVKDKDSSGSDICFSRIGSVQEVNADPQHQFVHRGVGIFSVSLEVEGTPNFKPTPGTGDEASLIFTLVSVRTWGITECVAPIVHASDKWS